ncbi:hypothetical protein GBAR_LOCUS2971 [Geodia barretti]|uniref:Uncharacterized protein n=1 Tax=Geodia barretti TaxID=519541 RepID=A0AA35R1I7_GEOBA|nr:hypothetical protein GBAR_LOCUS2971 [Geodia barretti]
MSGRVHGHRVREPRVVSRPGPSSQRGPAANTSSSLAQAWAAFGEAKSALEKLNSSPPAKSSHAHPPPLAPPPTTTAGETHGPVADYRGFPRPASSGRKREGFPSGPGKRETSSGKKEPQKAGSERASRRAREEGRRGRREKDGCVSLSTPASHKSTAIPSPHPHTSTTLPSSHPHSNSTAMFGPPVSFESPIPHSGNSPTPEDKYSKPSRVSQSSSPKINLPEDTLATLRSKVEAQKQAVEATNSRLQSLRQPPVTSAPCLYPLPEGLLRHNRALYSQGV